MLAATINPAKPGGSTLAALRGYSLVEVRGRRHWDNTVRIWDSISREPLGDPLTGHTGSIRAVVLGRIGEREVIVSASDDHTVRIWDAGRRSTIAVLDLLDGAHAVALSTASLYVATAVAVCAFTVRSASSHPIEAGQAVDAESGAASVTASGSRTAVSGGANCALPTQDKTPLTG